MKLKFDYKIDVLIQKPITLVTDLYINRQTMSLWEKGLDHIEDVSGYLFETGSIGYLVFKFGEQEMKMKVSVVSNALPHQITQIYEVEGAWNQCINRFDEIDGQTKWTMDVIFILESEKDIPKERFIAKTTEAMHIFKNFVEHYEA